MERHRILQRAFDDTRVLGRDFEGARDGRRSSLAARCRALAAHDLEIEAALRADASEPVCDALNAHLGRIQDGLTRCPAPHGLAARLEAVAGALTDEAPLEEPRRRLRKERAVLIGSALLLAAVAPVASWWHASSGGIDETQFALMGLVRSPAALATLVGCSVCAFGWRWRRARAWAWLE